MKTEMGSKQQVRASVDNPEEVAKFMQSVPVRQMYDQFQYLDKTILPAIERKQGRKSRDYIFFSELLKTLVYAAALYDRLEVSQRRASDALQMLHFFRQRCDLLEREVQKFTTLEDILLTDGLDRYAKAIIEKLGVKP